MLTASEIEADVERTARQSSWANPTTLHFEESYEDGVFEVYAEDGSGEYHMLDIITADDDVASDARSPPLEHKAMVRNVTHDPERAFRTLQKVRTGLDGFGNDYINDDRIVTVSNGRAPRMVADIGTDISSYGPREWQRLRNEVQATIGVPENEVAAMLGKNAVVVDTQFDVTGSVTGGMHGWNSVLNVPIGVLREDYSVDPRNVLVVEQNADEVLFVADGEYYFRGTNESVFPSYDDGWICELDRPASSIEDVKENHIKPDSVQAAEQQDREVRRQGDWFFVEQHDEFMPTGISRTPELQPDGEDPFLQNHIPDWLGHDAQNPSRCLVKGSVEHLNDDHSVLELGNEWYEAVHNGIDSVSFECEAYNVREQNRGGLFSHNETHGRFM